MAKFEITHCVTGETYTTYIVEAEDKEAAKEWFWNASDDELEEHRDSEPYFKHRDSYTEVYKI